MESEHIPVAGLQTRLASQVTIAQRSVPGLATHIPRSQCWLASHITPVQVGAQVPS
jgi:hypothetical protein